MPKTISTTMQTHLDGEVTSLASMVAIERRDGVRLFFTDHDTDIDMSSSAFFGDRLNWMQDTYLANVGFSRAAVSLNQASIDNSEVEAILNSSYVNSIDLDSGKYDFARCYLFKVNWNDLTQGIIKLPASGWLGEVTQAKNKGTYTVELRGLGQAFSRRIGETYTPGCKVDLFSRRCGLAEQSQFGVISGVTDNRTFQTAITPATFSTTLVPVVNPSFETDTNVDPSIAGWTGTNSQTVGQWRATTLGTPGPTDGSNQLQCASFAPHDIQRLFTIECDAVLLPVAGGTEPVVAEIDAGEVLVEVNVDIVLDEGTKDEASIGIEFLDTLGATIAKVRSPMINRINHLLDAVASTTYQRVYSCPPLTRSIKIELGAENVEGTVCRTLYDNVVVNVIPVPVLATGLDRDSVALPDWFDNGLVVMRSGLNDGRAMEIITYTSGTDEIVTFLPFPEALAIGDVFEIWPGCKKRWEEDCTTKWNNGINFQGEPFVPSQDEAFQSIDAK